MPPDSSPAEKTQVKKRPRSWFRFSLRTLLILTIVVGVILSQAALEIATARKSDTSYTATDHLTVETNLYGGIRLMFTKSSEPIPSCPQE